MKLGISMGINVKEIEKARLQPKGDKVWLNATVYVTPDEPDTYGQHGMITQDVTKEEKDNGVKGHILGNIKVFWRDEDQNKQESYNPEPRSQGLPPDDDIPF